jgi:putative transposase
MQEWMSLFHVRWDCKYHVVIVPKYRRRLLYGKVKTRLGPILRDLAAQKGIDVLEGHLQVDHVHMCLRVPPKYSIAYTIGFLKGKSAIRVHRQILQQRHTTGMHFWARGYCVSTVGLDEDKVRQYIR